MNLPNGWFQSALPVLWPAVWVLAAVVVGLFVERVLCGSLLRGTFVRHHPWFGIGLDALRPGIVFWSIAIGIHAAMTLSPLDRNLVHILDGALLVLAFGSFTWVAARFAGRAIHTQAAQVKSRVLSPSLLATIVQVTVVIIGLLIIFQSLGIAIAPLLTALGVGGLAVALALQPTLANLFAGLQLVASREVRPGDYISVGGFEGFVVDVTWRTTSLRDLSNNLVIVPNQTIATTIFLNYRLTSPAVPVELPFTAKADMDPDEVQRLATDAAVSALRDLGISTLDGAGPSVRFDTMDGESVRGRVMFRVPESADAGRARNETLKRLLRALRAPA